MLKSYEVSFLDSRSQVRTFLESGKDIADATNKICDKLKNPDGLFCGAPGWMHVETVEVV